MFNMTYFALQTHERSFHITRGLFISRELFSFLALPHLFNLSRWSIIKCSHAPYPTHFHSRFRPSLFTLTYPPCTSIPHPTPTPHPPKGELGLPHHFGCVADCLWPSANSNSSPSQGMERCGIGVAWFSLGRSHRPTQQDLQSTISISAKSCL